MPPLTVKILFGALQMHGPDATIASDNQGVDFLLASIQRELYDQAVAREDSGLTVPREDSDQKLAFDPSGYSKSYLRVYVRDYPRNYVKTIRTDTIQKQQSPSTKPSGPSSSGGSRR